MRFRSRAFVIVKHMSSLTSVCAKDIPPNSTYVCNGLNGNHCAIVRCRYIIQNISHSANCVHNKYKYMRRYNNKILDHSLFEKFHHQKNTALQKTATPFLSSSNADCFQYLYGIFIFLRYQAAGVSSERNTKLYENKNEQVRYIRKLIINTRKIGKIVNAKNIIISIDVRNASLDSRWLIHLTLHH